MYFDPDAEVVGVGWFIGEPCEIEAPRAFGGVVAGCTILLNECLGAGERFGGPKVRSAENGCGQEKQLCNFASAGLWFHCNDPAGTASVDILSEKRRHVNRGWLRLHCGMNRRSGRSHVPRWKALQFFLRVKG